MDFTQRLNNIMEERGLSSYRIYKDTSIPEATIGRWKNGKAIASGTNLQKLANYLDVSVDYLLGKTDIKKAPSFEDAELKRMIDVFPKLPPEVRAQLLGTAEAIVKSNSKNK